MALKPPKDPSDHRKWSYYYDGPGPYSGCTCERCKNAPSLMRPVVVRRGSDAGPLLMAPEPMRVPIERLGGMPELLPVERSSRGRFPRLGVLRLLMMTAALGEPG